MLKKIHATKRGVSSLASKRKRKKQQSARRTALALTIAGAAGAAIVGLGLASKGRDPR
jgi:hypothetical protein